MYHLTRMFMFSILLTAITACFFVIFMPTLGLAIEYMFPGFGHAISPYYMPATVGAFLVGISIDAVRFVFGLVRAISADVRRMMS